MSSAEPSVASSVEDEASAWFARLQADGVSAREIRRFERWRDGNPRHAEAYAECEALWRMVLTVAAEPEIHAMRREALAAEPEAARFGWEKLTALAATLVLLLVAGAMLWRTEMPGTPAADAVFAEGGDAATYRTGIGQRSEIRLADGTVVELNADTLIRIAYSDDQRRVRLLRGQALFDVAHDPSRPFSVEADGKRITALGTAFDVRLRDGELRVTLIEGEVSVAREEGLFRPLAGGEERRLRAGEELVTAAAMPFEVRPANVTQSTSWRTGRVIFADEPLAEVVEEINRYSRRQVVLSDDSLGDLRVSGVFRAGSVNSFATALGASFPVESRYDEAEDRIVLSWR
jgi:transmembrane sensor